MWFARIDGDKDSLAKACKVLADQIDIQRMVAYQHEGRKDENPHCHFVVESLNIVQKQSFVARYKSIFDIKTKNDHSCKVWDGRTDGETALSYMFHDSAREQLICKGVSEDELEYARKINESVQKVVEQNKEKASNKLVEKAIEHFSSEKPEKYNILKFMLECIHKGENYHPGAFRLKSFVEEVEIKLCKNETELDIVCGQMYNNLWRV